MRKYIRKTQVLFTEQQYQELLEISRRKHKSVGTLLREAAERLYLKDERSRQKTEALESLLSLEETEVPEDYQQWEQQYLDEKCAHDED